MLRTLQLQIKIKTRALQSDQLYCARSNFKNKSRYYLKPSDADNPHDHVRVAHKRALRRNHHVHRKQGGLEKHRIHARHQLLRTRRRKMSVLCYVD